MRLWSSAAKSMLPENAKCSMTPLADTKHIFREIFIFRSWLRPRAVSRLRSRFARDEIIKSLCSAGSELTFSQEIRVSVPLQATVDTLYEIKYWGLRTLNIIILTYFCCGASTASEQQHNQDLREINKVRRILELITFSRKKGIAFHQSALRQFLLECIEPRTTQIKNTGKFGGWESASFAAKTQSFLCKKFSTTRLEVLPNLRHAGVFQMSTMVSLWLVQALNLTEMSICSSTPQHGGYTNSSFLEGDEKVRKCHVMLFLRTCMSRKMDVILTISFCLKAEIEITKLACVLRPPLHSCRRGRVSAFCKA